MNVYTLTAPRTFFEMRTIFRVLQVTFIIIIKSGHMAWREKQQNWCEYVHTFRIILSYFIIRFAVNYFDSTSEGDIFASMAFSNLNVISYKYCLHTSSNYITKASDSNFKTSFLQFPINCLRVYYCYMQIQLNSWCWAVCIQGMPSNPDFPAANL